MNRHFHSFPVFVCLLLVSTAVFLLRQSSGSLDWLSFWLSSNTQTPLHADIPHASSSHANTLHANTSGSPSGRFAFATFLSGSSSVHSHLPANSTTSQDELEDGYFAGARHLTYSLLHHPETKSTSPIPFLVLTTSSISDTKRARLEADGATVIIADPVPLPPWIRPGENRWKEIMNKLRLFARTEYDKICFLGADQLVIAPLDGVFEDPVTVVTTTLSHADMQVKVDEPALPPDYMIAARPDTWGPNHPLPPPEKDYLNAGFYVFRPSIEMFEYYMELLQIKGRFSGTYVEQDMFNFAHRRDGGMPWRSLDWRWAINWATIQDLEAGVWTFHGK